MKNLRPKHTHSHTHTHTHAHTHTHYHHHHHHHHHHHSSLFQYDVIFHTTLKHKNDRYCQHNQLCTITMFTSVQEKNWHIFFNGILTA